MFAEFGQAPLSLKLDLSTYEDSWTHVAAFRRAAGWLMMVKATIQSEHDLLSDKLVVACFDNGEPIPSWRAVHLTQCHWHGLEPHDEEPPELLDDLLCDEEGAFYLRWQRETNRDLAALHDRTQRQLEILEDRNRIRMREIERQIAELRRRRRLPDASPDARNSLTAIIRELEAESDEEAARFLTRRRRIQQRAEAAEEAMWLREDILFEVEPLCLIRWQAGDLRAERHPVPVWKGGRYYSQPRAFAEAEPESQAAVLAKLRAALDEKAKQEAPEASAPETVAPGKPRVEHLPKASPIRKKLSVEPASRQQTPAPQAPKSKEAIKLERRIRSLKQMVASADPGSHHWSRARRFLEQNERQLAALAKASKKETPPEPMPSLTPPASPLICDAQLPLPEFGEDLKAERAKLAGQLEALEIQGRKYLPGSPKTRRNLEQRGDLECRIAALDRRIAAASPPALDESEPSAPKLPWTPERVATLTEMWLAGHSANTIAQALGGTRRNAVIGKAKRLGLPFNYGKDGGDAPPA